MHSRARCRRRVAFEAAKSGFAIYVKNVPTYEVVYGTLAALPVFLIWIYVCWLIVLAGAAITATLTLDASEWSSAPPPRSRDDASASLPPAEQTSPTLERDVARKSRIENRTLACRIPPATLHCGQLF